MKTQYKHAVILASALVGFGCTKGYESKQVGDSVAAAGAGTNDGAPAQGGNTSQGGNSNANWSDVGNIVHGNVDGGQYDGKLTVFIDQPNQALVFRMPVPTSFALPVFSKFQIPNLPGATVTNSLDSTGSPQFLVNMPLKYIAKGTNLAVYNQLPNGDPLPFMPAGEARGFAFELPQKANYRLHLYFTVNAAAAFIEIPEIPEIPYLPTYMGFPIKNDAKTQIIGFLGLFARKGSNAAGVYVASRIPDSAAIMIDELIKY